MNYMITLSNSIHPRIKSDQGQISARLVGRNFAFVPPKIRGQSQLNSKVSWDRGVKDAPNRSIGISTVSDDKTTTLATR